MKAIAVYPGKPHSMHLEDVPLPKVTAISSGQGVLVKVLRLSATRHDHPFADEERPYDDS